MELLIECPACKAAFRGQMTQEHTWFICPYCQSQFDASPMWHQASGTGLPIPVGAPLAPPVAVPSIPVGTLVQSPVPSSDDDEVPIEFLPSSGTRRIRYRKKKSPLPTIAGLLGILAFVALISAVVHNAAQNPVERIAARKEVKKIARKVTPARTPKRRPTVEAVESTDPADMPEPIDLSSETPSLELEAEAPETETPEAEPGPISPVRHLLDGLDQSGEQCKAFQFLPENDAQYEQLQAFALQLSMAKDFLTEERAGEIDSNDRDALTRQSAHWLQAVRTLVPQADAEAPGRLSRINAFAKRAFEKRDSANEANSQIIFYGCVFLKGSAEHHPILKLDRKQVYFSVPSVAGLEQSKGGSYRMFFVEVPKSPSQKRMPSPGGGLIRVTSGRVTYSFDPMRSEN